MDNVPSRKPGTFIKGDPRINRTMGPRSKRLRPPPLLRDMRWVLHHSEQDDRTAGHRNCRKWLESDVVHFMKTLLRLERQFERAAATWQRRLAQEANQS